MDKNLGKSVVIALAISLIFPVLILFLLSPLVDGIMVSESKREAFRLAEHIANSFGLHDRLARNDLSGPEFIKEVRDIKRQFDLYKLTLFSGTGEVLFSTDQRDLGFIAFEDFFANVSKGEGFAVYRGKGEKSLEGVPLSADVIEAYFPLMKDGRFGGAIEIYYDVTEPREDFRRLKIGFSAVLFVISFVAFSAVMFILRNAEMRKHRQAETEEALSREQLKAETIFSSMGDNVIIQDRDYKIIYQNRVNKETFGDHKGEYCYKVYEGIDSVCQDCPVELTYQDGMIHRVEKVTHTPNGTMNMELTASPLLDSNGRIVAGIKVVRDITEKKRLEEQLRHSQKMEALGTLTSGISHEFNNVLTAIIGYSEILRDELPAENDLRKCVDVIYEAGKRAETLTRGLLAYSRKQITKMSPVPLSGLMRDIEGMLAKIIGVDIGLRIWPASDALTVMADKNQIEQALINVITNAKDAMPQGGELAIRMEKKVVDDEFIRAHGFGKHGVYAAISVRDTGHGMDEKTKKRAFEPFFTTKEIGRGTGLGLSIVYGIVKNHGGYIDIISEPGKGTDFIIYLPLADNPS